MTMTRVLLFFKVRESVLFFFSPPRMRWASVDGVAGGRQPEVIYQGQVLAGVACALWLILFVVS